jgi:hypothetical protein
VRGNWRGVPLLETPKDMLSKALEMGVSFHRGPAFGEHARTLLSKVFERREKFLYLEKHF